METRKCIICGADFVPSRITNITCSKECQKIRHKQVDKEWKMKNPEKVKANREKHKVTIKKVKKVKIKEYVIYTPAEIWLMNFDKVENGLTKKQMICSALNMKYAEIQGISNAQFQELEKKARLVKQKEAENERRKIMG